MAIGDVPAITWDTGFTKQIDIGYPLLNTTSYSQPAPGSEFVRTPGGVTDAWVTGDDQILEGDVSFVPPSDATNPVRSGWDAADGWRAFFEWARRGNIFRFIPDKDTPGTYITCYLVEPMGGATGTEIDGTRTFRIKIRSSDGSSFDGY